ncbi:phosphoadenosine phosphosulfate reductase [Paraburkholderia bengalensis]|uniref:Phosphoadenosine phosphosulfate reductase n=1 Tax=Paraburkholderia bengalensis TaxID=2747562 RepID=A0ABU8ISJ3_9BURK
MEQNQPRFDFAMSPSPVVVAYGMGTNSVALLVGMHERGERPDLILSADTGGERPQTYEHRDMMDEWCKKVGFPPIVTIRKGGRAETLEENCLRMSMLPSIAYGFKGCSLKFKREPQDRFVNSWEPAQLAWECGRKVVKLIGYDAGEERRAKITEDAKYEYRYPLIEWGWDRDDCIAATDRTGLPRPGKSACFFCPSSKVAEIRDLRDNHPHLFARALAMESNAELTSVKGLGRRFAWRDHAIGGPLCDIPRESYIEEACDCYDGAA